MGSGESRQPSAGTLFRYEIADPEAAAAYEAASLRRVLPLIRVAGAVTAAALPVYFLWDTATFGDTAATLAPRLVGALALVGVLVLTFTRLQQRPVVLLVAGYSAITLTNVVVLARLDAFVEGQSAFVIGPVLAALLAPRLRDLAVVLVVAAAFPAAAMVVDGATADLVTIGPWFLLATMFGIAIWFVLDSANRAAFLSQRSLERERERSESLLLNVLPAEVAARLKEGVEVADRADSVTVLFADVVGFTAYARERDPREVVRLLDDLFAAFDELVAAAGAEKIKTIGDGYMAAAGIWGDDGDHAHRLVGLARAMHREAELFSARVGRDWRLRIGVHSGPVVSGVIGRTKFAFDLWGDTVNVASRMETHGTTGRTQLSVETVALLGLDTGHVPARVIELKGHGTHEVYWLDELEDAVG